MLSNVSNCGDLSPPWTTLIRIKSDRLAGLRFIDPIKSFILTSESCSGFTGRIFDRGVVDRSIANLLIFKLTNYILQSKSNFIRPWAGVTLKRFF